MGDHRLALFLEQAYELFLLGHQRVDLAGFVVEEGGDGALFGERGEWNRDRLHFLGSEMGNR